MIDKYSTIKEIEQAAEVLAEVMRLKDETIKVLKEKGEIADKLLASQEALLKVKQEQIAELQEQLDTTFALAQRATDLANKSI